MEAIGLTGEVINTIASEKVNKTNWYANTMCKYVISCGETSRYDYSVAMILSFMTLTFLERVFYLANVYLHHNRCDKMNQDLKIKAISHVLSLDQTYYDTHNRSEIQSSMNVHSISNLISWNLPYILMLAINLVTVLLYLMRIDWHMALMAATCALSIRYLVLSPIEKVERNVHKYSGKLHRLSDQIENDALTMIQTVKYFSKEEEHISDFSVAIQRIKKNIEGCVVLRCVREFLCDFLRQGMFCGCLFFYLYTHSAKESNASHLITYMLMLKRFTHYMDRLRGHWDMLVREFPDIERMLTLMETKSKMAAGEKKLQNVTGEIEFQDVHFTYPSRPGEKVLKGLNLKIQPFKMTAIVGDSGAGKSTITKMVMRMYDPQRGCVKIDGHDLRSLDLRDFHQKIGIVSQSPDLFDVSLGENIAYGSTSPSCNIKDIADAAKIANCDFIEKFRAGFDAFTGGQGLQLSGGQKQRIAIARAAIRNPDILILDEATSALDAENEKTVQEALENIMKGQTVLVIAHRLSTVKNADEILCMREGEVVEKGNHHQLMEKNGVYANLVRKQLVDEKPDKTMRRSLSRHISSVDASPKEVSSLKKSALLRAGSSLSAEVDGVVRSMSRQMSADVIDGASSKFSREMSRQLSSAEVIGFTGMDEED